MREYELPPLRITVTRVSQENILGEVLNLIAEHQGSSDPTVKFRTKSDDQKSSLDITNLQQIGGIYVGDQLARLGDYIVKFPWGQLAVYSQEAFQKMVTPQAWNNPNAFFPKTNP